MDMKKKLKKIVAVSMLGAIAASSVNADVVDRIVEVGGLAAFADLGCYVWYGKNGSHMFMNWLGYSKGFKNEKTNGGNNN